MNSRFGPACAFPAGGPRLTFAPWMRPVRGSHSQAALGIAVIFYEILAKINCEMGF